jgi:hypothetical protein
MNTEWRRVVPDKDITVAPVLKPDSKRLSPILLGLSAVLMFVLGCANLGGFVERTDRTSQGAATDDAARFLAGLHGRADCWFASLERTPAWQAYARRLDRAWSELEQHQFQPVRDFRKRELAAIPSNSSFLFYPFSGPDVLYPRLFFPNRRLIVMAGLEPVGSLRALYSYREDNIESALSGWSQSVSSIFGRGFFVTGEMDREFRGRIADGLLPMILLLLSRSGHRIDRMAYGQLSPTGEFVAKGAPAPGVEKLPDAGVEIEFHWESEATTRTLYYFSTDLAKGFGQDPRFRQFLRRLGPSDTLIKSASFLPHWRMCDAIRDFILQNSDLILQDDTGVTFRQLQALNWDVELFGKYSHPDRPFQREYQPDLAKAFHVKTNVRQLGFALGYGAGRRPSSLMLARRTAATLPHRQE